MDIDVYVMVIIIIQIYILIFTLIKNKIHLNKISEIFCQVGVGQCFFAKSFCQHAQLVLTEVRGVGRES